MKNKLVIVLVAIQVLVIVGLIFKIGRKSSNVLGDVNIAPIYQKNIVNNDTSWLKHYYEPTSGVQTNINNWVPHSDQAEYTINTDTLNDRFDYDIQKRENVFRIITLGDSYTFGLYVNTSESWPEQLEDMFTSQTCNLYSSYEVINLGVHGYDIQYSLERFKLRGAKYNPDLVIWFLKSDDVYQVNELMLGNVHKYKKSMEESGELEKEIEKGNYVPFWNQAMQEMVEQHGDEIPSIQQSFITDFFDQNNSDLLVVSYKYDMQYIVDLFKDIFDQNKVSMLELTETRNNEAYHFPNDYHPNPEGHKVIAKDVYDYLVSSDLIGCN